MAAQINRHRSEDDRDLVARCMLHVAGVDRTIRIWEPNTFSCLHTLENHHRSYITGVTAVHLSPMCTCMSVPAQRATRTKQTNKQALSLPLIFRVGAALRLARLRNTTDGLVGFRQSRPTDWWTGQASEYGAWGRHNIHSAPFYLPTRAQKRKPTEQPWAQQLCTADRLVDPSARSAPAILTYCSG